MEGVLKGTPSWRRGIEPKENHDWNAFHFGGWINPSLTHVHPCIVEHSIWGFLIGYLYEHMSLFYVSLSHLLVYIK
jgi:hypothetical protein